MSLAAAAGAKAPAPPPRGDIARAKVNLTLEIRGRRVDGYHELESLVLFADFGDRLEYRSGGPFSLGIEGPFGAALGGCGNLVERAAGAFWLARGRAASGAFRLEKHIPVAAGLGGGSADAAAALRLLATEHGAGDPGALLPLAAGLGADVPCCLRSAAAIMTGIGETLHPLPPLTPVPAVLVNPMLPLVTRDVFRALDAPPLAHAPAAPALPELRGLPELLAYSSERANDLEAPARRLLPVIGDVLEALRAARGARLVRLSGSGPSCYAIFGTQAEAASAAAAIGLNRPGWWVRAVTLS